MSFFSGDAAPAAGHAAARAALREYSESVDPPEPAREDFWKTAATSWMARPDEPRRRVPGTGPVQAADDADAAAPPRRAPRAGPKVAAEIPALAITADHVATALKVQRATMSLYD